MAGETYLLCYESLNNSFLSKIEQLIQIYIILTPRAILDLENIQGVKGGLKRALIFLFVGDTSSRQCKLQQV